MWRTKVARVAKNVVLRAVETKRVGIANTGVLLPQLAGLASNVTFTKFTDLFVQGTEADDMVGREVVLKGTRRKFSFTNSGSANPDQPRTIRICCLKVDPYLTTTTLTAGQLFVQGATADVGTWILRTDKEPTSIIQKVYYDRVFKTPMVNLPGQLMTKNINISIDFHNMKWHRDTNSSIIGSNFDIIWVIMSFTPGNIAGAQNLEYSSDERVYFKDP